jgi:hypothetical protein
MRFAKWMLFGISAVGVALGAGRAFAAEVLVVEPALIVSENAALVTDGDGNIVRDGSGNAVTAAGVNQTYEEGYLVYDRYWTDSPVALADTVIVPQASVPSSPSDEVEIFD